MNESLLAAASWWIVLAALGWISLPIAALLFARFPDRGVGFARPLALVVPTYVSWAASSLGLSRPAALMLSLGVLGAASGVALSFVRRRVRIPGIEIVREEVVFAACFVLFAAIRGFHPDLLGSEKFVDFAIFNAVQRAPTFPPEDPWLAGYVLNYYYFGHLLFAQLGQMTAIAPEIAVNLAAATVPALVFSAALSIGRFLDGRFSSGLAAATAVAFMTNLHPALQVLAGAPFGVVDLWAATRLVSGAITEFPLFIFLLGDLHAHAMALVLDVTLIALLLTAGRDDRRVDSPSALVPRAGMAALVLTAMMLANPWDVPAGLSVLLLVSLGRLRLCAGPVRSLLGAVGIVLGMLVAARLLASPFYRHYAAPVPGLGLVHDRTAPAAFFTMFGFLLLPGAIVTFRAGQRFIAAGSRAVVAAGSIVVLGAALWTGSVVLVVTLLIAIVCAGLLLSGRDLGNGRAAIPLLTTASAMLAAAELVYVRDLLPEEGYRLNTVFKLYFQAWLLLGLSLPTLAREALLACGTGAARALCGAALAAGAGASLYGFGAHVAMVASADTAWTLDGMRYMREHHPGDAAAIHWLRTRIPERAVLVEATAGPRFEGPLAYSTRISTHTGLPTLLGWAAKETVWRGFSPLYERRRLDIAAVYESADAGAASDRLCGYGVRFVVVGELERKFFPGPGIDKFASRPDLFRRSFEEASTSIFETIGCRGRSAR